MKALSSPHRFPVPASAPHGALAAQAGPLGSFVDEGGETWYRIEGTDRQPPFFMVLAGDSDLWAFVSSSGSLAAGRRDEEGAFFPYETVDKIHKIGRAHV